MILALLLLLAGVAPSAADPMVLADEDLALEAGEVRSIDINLSDRLALISFSYDVAEGESINVILIGRTENGERFLRRMGGDSGGFRQPIRQRGEYELVFDNRGNQEQVTAHIRIDLAFDAVGLAEPATLSTTQRALVAAVSAGFLAFVSIWFVRRFRPAIERRRRDGPYPSF